MSHYTISQTAKDDSWIVTYSPYNDNSEALNWATGETLIDAVCKIIDVNPKERLTPLNVASELKSFMVYEDGDRRSVDCIKLIRALTGCGLKEAKEAFDDKWSDFYG